MRNGCLRRSSKVEPDSNGFLFLGPPDLSQTLFIEESGEYTMGRDQEASKTDRETEAKTWIRFSMESVSKH